MADRLMVVATSPRLPAGLLSASGWEALKAGQVYAADPDDPQAAAVRSAGIDVRPLEVDPGHGSLLAGASAEAPDARSRARALRDLAGANGVAVWLTGQDVEADTALVRAAGDLAARDGELELEVVYGSWDPAGARLLDVVTVMDRLRSPGGCPWDAKQTHQSLAKYLVEEAYETVDAIEDGDLEALREELGDVLLQVAFHSRLAEELDDDERFSIDDVAGDLVAKLVRRHPHVFAGRDVADADEVNANWEQIKAAEKGRTSAVDGVVWSQPALALTAQLVRRAQRAGAELPSTEVDVPDTDEAVGELILAIAAQAAAKGIDAEAAVRAAARRYARTLT